VLSSWFVSFWCDFPGRRGLRVDDARVLPVTPYLAWCFEPGRKFVAKGFGMVCTRVPGSRRGSKRQKAWRVNATFQEITALTDHLVCEGIQRLVLESTEVIRGFQDQQSPSRR
jgi:hypothetical protein